MISQKLYRKAQSLPLNTIVIAILVILVLLVIIVFFTSNVSESGEQINENNAGQCSANNPVITTLGYEEAEEIGEDDTCREGWDRIAGISNCCVR